MFRNPQPSLRFWQERATMSTASATPSSVSSSAKLECPECAAAIAARPTLAGEILDCGDCGAELEVTSLSPLTLALAPEVEEDWGE